MQVLQQSEVRPRAVQIAVQRALLCQPGLLGDVVWVSSQRVLQVRSRACEVSGGLQLLCALERVSSGLRQMLVEHLPDLRPRNEADEMVDRGAILEQHGGRQAANTDLLCELLLLLGVDLRELEATAVLCSKAIQH